MKLSLNWLREFVDFPLLDKPHLAEVVVGHVLEVEKHPDADKLNIAQVDVGEGEPYVIVCGAANLKKGQKVPVALPGVTLPGDFTIARREIRGVESNGMICAEDEIGLSEERQEGIMVLDDKWEVGTRMSDVLDLSGYSPTKLGQLITLRTAEVEGVEVHNKDYIYDIDNKSLTHRPDLWGHYGFARELAAILDSKLTPFEPKPSVPTKGDTVSVKLDKEICPRFCSVVVKDLKIEESPQWLQDKLETVGISPVNNIVDITNFVMVEIGHPMHAFDYDKAGNKLEVRFAKEGEELETIDHKTRKLTKEDPVITNGKDVISLAGIMGGASTEISDNTTNIILEAANWSPTVIRRSSTNHGLRSEASQRFEKSLDPELAELAIKRALQLVQEVCPDTKVAGPITDEYPSKPKPVILKLKHSHVESYIGAEITIKDSQKILESLGFKVDATKDELKVTVPSWRATKDVTREVDLIEEIARIYGYDNIPCIIPDTPTETPMPNRSRTAEHNLRTILQGLGATEVYNYSFYSKSDLQNALLKEENHLQLENYLAETQTHLRTSMVPNFLHSIHTNLKYEDHFAVFELGRTYIKTDQFFPLEEKKLIIGVVSKSKKEQQFFKLKGFVEEVLAQYLESSSINPTDTPAPYAHPKQAAEIRFEDHTIGQLFNVHPLVKENFDLANSSIAIAEINLGQLLNHQKAVTSFEELPKFPDLDFDISVVVDEKITVKDLSNAIKSADKHELIHNLEVFDIYRGKNLDANKKAIAFKITLRHPDRTLTDEEAATLQEAVFNNLEKLGGEIRGR